MSFVLMRAQQESEETRKIAGAKDLLKQIGAASGYGGRRALYEKFLCRSHLNKK